MSIEPAKRVIAVGVYVRPNESAAARFAGFGSLLPTWSWGSRPRLYA